jgi:hypothetical protein
VSKLFLSHSLEKKAARPIFALISRLESGGRSASSIVAALASTACHIEVRFPRFLLLKEAAPEVVWLRSTNRPKIDFKQVYESSASNARRLLQTARDYSTKALT